MNQPAKSNGTISLNSHILANINSIFISYHAKHFGKRIVLSLDDIDFRLLTLIRQKPQHNLSVLFYHPHISYVAI